MLWLHELRRRLTILLRRDRFDSDLEEEMQSHLEMLAEDNPAQGMAAARRQFGNRTLLREASDDAWGWSWLEQFAQDIRFALRSMRKTPGFTAVAVLSLALGIGANTVVFSVVNTLLLRPLPVESPERVFFVNHSGGPAQSFPNYRDIRDRNTVFSSLYMYRIAPMAVGTGVGARRVWGYLVTGNYFETLGVRPALGRFFGPQEDRQVNANPYAVLSYDCWQTRFAGDPSIVGRTVRINTYPYTVLGVAPKGFHGTEIFYWAEIWAPLSMQPQIEGSSWLETRNTFNGWVAGRLKPGVTPEQANANLRVIAEQLGREHRVNEGMTLTVSEPGLVGSLLRGPVSAFSTGVMLLASLVLLAACANIAGLLSARLTDRGRELAIRLSIGAGRGRLLRQLLTESVVLSLAGGVAGGGLSVLLLRLLTDWRAPLDFPIRFDVTPDLSVFAFTFAVALATGILFGTVPAIQAWKADPNAGLKGDAPQIRTRRWAFRDLLFADQVAVCCLLVTASFLALRGLWRSFETPLGFEAPGVAAVGYELGMAGYDEESGRLFHQRALERISRIPGIQAAAYASSIPLSIDQSTTTIFAENVTDFRPKNRIGAAYYYVSPAYFHAIGTRLLRGRDFERQDAAKGAPQVAIVNENLARKVLHEREWLGQRFHWGANGPLVEVIGIVENGKYTTLTEDPRPAVFFPMERHYSSTAVLIARSARPESEVAAEMTRALTGLDPQLPLYGVGSLTQMLGLVFLPARAAVVSLGAFGVLALMLVVSGIYGLAAYGVSRRIREIGIRIAVGARPADLARTVFTRTAVLVVIGCVAGLALGLIGSQILSSVVMGVTARDPVVIGGAALTMAFVSIAAASGPLRRAMRIDPVRALRQD